MSDHDKMLERIRALLAKAASTEHEAEAELFRAKADELMTKYAINQWQIDQAQAGVNARPEPIVKNVDFQWYWKADSDLGGGLWSVFTSVAQHCRCAIAYKYASNTIPVIGLESDIAYMDMLFTHLFMQMVEQMDPHPRPGEQTIEALVRMKEAGLKWEEIFRRLRKAGHYPEHEPWNPSKMDYAGKYTRYCAEHGRERVRVTPTVYRRSFAMGYSAELRKRLRHQRDEQGQNTGGMALAIRDIALVVQDKMFELFPDQAKRSRSLAKTVNVSDAAIARGAQAGREAEIISNAARVQKTPELG